MNQRKVIIINNTDKTLTFVARCIDKSKERLKTNEIVKVELCSENYIVSKKSNTASDRYTVSCNV